MTAIPERAPIGDLFAGMLLHVEGASLLAMSSPPDGAEVLHTGPLIVRYGLRYLEKAHLSVVPGLVALDYGDMLTGEAAWDFLLRRSNMHPRADVFGYRNDGQDEMIVVKRLDLVLPPQPLAYADADATQPLASISALIAGVDAAAGLPPRLLAYVPRYDSFTDWQTENPHV